MNTEPLSKQYKSVSTKTGKAKQMAYHDSGEGDAVVFLHGNPTSSYLWRNIIPYVRDRDVRDRDVRDRDVRDRDVRDRARCVAPDLIGHGDSDKLDLTDADSYRFVEHREYLDGLLDQLDLGDKITLVIHDWGSALGFDWANRHRDRVAGICYMEAIVRPISSWDDWPAPAVDIFKAFRSPAGEELIMTKNLFVEAILPASIIRDLSATEHNEYRRPFTEPEHRRPTLTWPREIPIEGKPADVMAIVQDYATWLSTCEIPKLFINAEPGSILTGPQREFCRTWPNQIEVTVAGSHFIQEDSPDEIGAAIVDWLGQLAGYRQ